MRIAVDARELAGRPTGVGRYLAGLLREWMAAASAGRAAHELLLYSHAPIELPLEGATARLVPGAGGTAWEQIALAPAIRRDRADVLFSPGYTAPLVTRVPLVVAVHDVSFAAHPEWFTPREGLRRRFLCRRASRRARTVVTISNFSRDEIVRHLGIAATKIAVIPPGIDRPAGGSAAAPSARPPRLLFVGSIFNRRHVPELIAAFADVAARHAEASLDLVGDNRTFPAQDLDAIIASHGLEGRARWRKYVSEQTLSELYREARGFAFLSAYEGLGLTPLEALSVGVPPLLLDTPVARESCGDAALYVNGGDRAATAAAIERLLFDPAASERLLTAAPAVLSRYSWPDAARATLQVLEGAA